MSSCHKFKTLEVSGGFLDGLKIDFDDDLNCIIGGRGTGKTTVLELIRYAFDRMPIPSESGIARESYKTIDTLVKSNLGDGSVKVTFETENGQIYLAQRSYDDNYLVEDENGEPVEIDLRRGVVFDFEVYSQHEIENIATDPHSQLEIIDKFKLKDIQKINDQIEEVKGEYRRNSGDIVKDQGAIESLTDQVRELPDIRERLKGYQTEGTDEQSLQVKAENELKDKRNKEDRLIDGISEVYQVAISRLKETDSEIESEMSSFLDAEFSESPNIQLIQKAQEQAAQMLQAFKSDLTNIIRNVENSENVLKSILKDLRSRHKTQELQYRKLLEDFEEERGKAKERNRLTRRKDELEKVSKDLENRKKSRETLLTRRDELQAKLSDLRDQRHHIRNEVAIELNERLSPMIRVQIEQYGNPEEYKELLWEAFKGSGLKFRTLVEKIVELIPPGELAQIIRDSDADSLQEQLDIDSDRAAKIIVQFRGGDEILEIETVEIQDKPIIELKDGENYKSSLNLSTGQKCTTILPILLLESERPLLIDQPEDNLDNAFVFDTIVKSIKAVQGKRQLIFITHNPNIPVLGDAKMVFVLHSTGEAASISNFGSVENVKEDIETIMEGGQEAFKLRMERYGY